VAMKKKALTLLTYNILMAGNDLSAEPLCDETALAVGEFQALETSNDMELLRFSICSCCLFFQVMTRLSMP
jgi:hypothetical protein